MDQPDCFSAFYLTVTPFASAFLLREHAANTGGAGLARVVSVPGAHPEPRRLSSLRVLLSCFST